MCKYIPKVKNSFLNDIYGKCDVKAFEDRCLNLVKEYNKTFSDYPADWFSSPGRVEIVGNHTDHNNGEVLCASISLDTLACVKPSSDGVIRFQSGGYPMMTINCDDLAKNEQELSTSTALVRGVASYYVEHGYKIGGFTACANSTVFKGAGVSSSASFELLVAEILNVYYNDGKIDPLTKAKAAQYAEAVYFGKPCGLLDQCAISLGGVSYIDFFDGHPHAEKLKGIPELSIVLVNAGGDHSALTDQYAAIREEMKTVAKYFGGEVLRDVDEKDFFAALPALRKTINGRPILRAVHFYEENRRVKECKKAIEDSDAEKFAEVVKSSGYSSMYLLQNCYPEGDKKQYIPSALEVLKRLVGVKTARIHGGGFAGTVIAFFDGAKEKELDKALETAFGKDNYYIVKVRKYGSCMIPNE